MITNEIIKEIYKQYDKKPKSMDCLDFALLFDKVGVLHNILVDPDTQTLTIDSIPEDSPFHQVALKNIYAFVPFEQWVAIVLHSSIIFLNTKRPITSIHIKSHKLSLWDKIKRRHVESSTI